MEKKVTKRMVLTAMLELDAIKSNADMLAYCTHEIELLDKKASTPRKENEANIAIKELIVETLKGLANAVTIDELRNANAEIGALSNQKVSSLMTQLKKENRVIRTENKKKAYFSVAE